MTIYAQTLTNPGAETGNTTGWTSRSGGVPAVSSGGYTGSYHFTATASGSTAVWDQEIDVSAYATAIDAGTAAARGRAYHIGFVSDADSGRLYLQAYDSGHTLLATELNDATDPDIWTLEEVRLDLPVGTRYVRLGTNNIRASGTQLSTHWDDFVLEISDDGEIDFPLGPQALQLGIIALSSGDASEADYPVDAHQLGAYSLGFYDAEELYALQFPIQATVAAETSSGLYEVWGNQLGAYALCRPNADRRDLRAWPFTQDDHDFWVIQLGSIGTLIYDTLTDQWAQWRSPGYAYWRGNDGVQWEGWNIACDTESGKLWIIDPEGRLDEDTTPITSVVTGGLSVRMRKNVPCYMGELTVSEGSPPSGFDDGSVGITLRTSDDQGNTYVNHGEVLGQGIGEDMTVRWYSLGNIPATGRVFEITDTGYARRIDGFNVEVPDDG